VPFEALVDHIYHVLTQPNIQHEMPPGVKAAAAPPVAAPAAALSDAASRRAGGMHGLLEILADRGAARSCTGSRKI